MGDLVEELPGTQSPARIDEMRKGMRTGAVAELQAMLQAVGAPRNTKGTVGLESDAGAFGDKTQLWVKQFQLATGLSPADGVVDEKTLLALHGAAERRESVFARSTDVGATTYGGQPLAFPKGKSPDGYRVLNQNDNPKVPLGNQSGLNANLRDQGCAVTAFAMVASHLTGQTVSPSDVNNDARNFPPGSSSFSSQKAAGSFGLAATVVDLATEPGADGTLLRAIDKGQGIMMRVDFKGDEDGDHTVVITGRTGSTVHGIDPATGGPVQMRIEADGTIRGGGWRHYEATAFTILDHVTDIDDSDGGL